MKAIDIHAHYLPELLVSKVKENQSRFPFVQVEDIPEGTVRFKVGDGKWTRPVHPNLMNLTNRKNSLRENNIDLQINAGWLDIFGYNLSPNQGAEWSRFLNEVLIEALDKEGENLFLPLATVPLQDGELAAVELEKSIKEGHLGAMIGSWIDLGEGQEPLDLDHPSLDPFWEKASQLEVPIFLHPVFAGEDPRTKPLGMVNTVARPNETTVALSRILYSGIPQRFPGLKLVVSHGGGTLPFILGRLQRNYEFMALKEENIYNPTEGFKKLYFDTVVFEPQALKFLMSMVDEDKIMLGSDDPFPIRDPRPRNVIEAKELQLSDSTKQALLYENAIKLFNIEIKETV
ncbi:amidohydrolase family protein [Bacillus sp. Marseille-P3661]|uniref:amidohydrolase family protein n=1 Tax=Bacillus sp. Marseille-P3661 TaxID=1936234 RepID=UPI000C81496E|nr:amidohydrolase family protein [Bacillus sp. Marseille-P3661]